MKKFIKFECLVLCLLCVLAFVACSGGEDETTDNSTVNGDVSAVSSSGYVSLYGGGYMDLGSYVKSDMDAEGRIVKTSFYSLSDMYGMLTAYMLHSYKDGKLTETGVYSFDSSTDMYTGNYTAVGGYRWEYDSEGRLSRGVGYTLGEGLPVPDGGYISLEYSGDALAAAVMSDELRFDFEDGRVVRETSLTDGDFATVSYDGDRAVKLQTYAKDDTAMTSPETVTWTLSESGELSTLEYGTETDKGSYSFIYSSNHKLVRATVNETVSSADGEIYTRKTDAKAEYSDSNSELMTSFVVEETYAMGDKSTSQKQESLAQYSVKGALLTRLTTSRYENNKKVYEKIDSYEYDAQSNCISEQAEIYYVGDGGQLELRAKNQYLYEYDNKSNRTREVYYNYNSSGDKVSGYEKLHKYDENGRVSETLHSDLEADGTYWLQEKSVYTRNAKGYVTQKTLYTSSGDGEFTLYTEYVYIRDENGEVVREGNRYYQDGKPRNATFEEYSDGSVKVREEYSYRYLANGALDCITAQRNEYKYDGDKKIIERVQTELFGQSEDSLKISSYGVCKYTYTVSGSVPTVEEHEFFSADGDKTGARRVERELDSFENTVMQITINYDCNGAIVDKEYRQYTYDAEGYVKTETVKLYDASGNLLEERVENYD